MKLNLPALLIAKDLPQNEKLLTALTVGMLPEKNVTTGLVLTKKQIDEKIELKKRNEVLEKEINLPITIDFPSAGSGDIFLKFEGSTKSSFEAKDEKGLQISNDGRLTFKGPARGTSVVFAAVVDGISRKIKINMI